MLRWRSTPYVVPARVANHPNRTCRSVVYVLYDRNTPSRERAWPVLAYGGPWRRACWAMVIEAEAGSRGKVWFAQLSWTNQASPDYRTPREARRWAWEHVTRHWLWQAARRLGLPPGFGV